MLSHTVPKKLLEHFAYEDPATRSRRLWRYQKAQAPYGRCAPRTATRWHGHFADPANATKEAEIEARLKREFEDPVNQFIDLIAFRTFAFGANHIRLLSGYLTILFHRSRARQAASAGQHQTMIDALRGVRDNEEMLSQLVATQTMKMIPGGLRRMLTRDEAIEAIDHTIAEHTTGDAVQKSYVQTMENMMAFSDEGMRNGTWSILHATPDKPFVIGDAPVVTWERVGNNVLVFGQGFARPDVEVLLPIFPTACLHVQPAVARTRPVHMPSTEEVNIAQAAFATQHCFANVRSDEIDALLQPHFGAVRIGIEGFSLQNIDHTKQLFEILMRQ